MAANRQTFRDEPQELTDLPRSNYLAWAVFAFGTIQMLGYVLDSKPLRGIGAAYLISPMPKVFSDVDGLETFASEFTLLLERADGTKLEVPITPELYSKLHGPYKRRNVYGAALSYAPRMPEALWQPVFRYGFAGPLLEELGLPTDILSAKIRITTKTAGRSDSWTLGAPPEQDPNDAS